MTAANCYQDSATDPIFGTSLGTQTENSILFCTTACGAQGYAYGGTESGNECFCGDTYPPASKRANGCTSPCPGDSSEMCGGHLKISVFTVPGK